MKTKIRKIRIAAMLCVVSAVSGSCSLKEDNEGVQGTTLRLVHPSQIDKKEAVLRFDSKAEKDERSLAYEKVAQDWNRDMILGKRKSIGIGCSCAEDQNP